MGTEGYVDRGSDPAGMLAATHTAMPHLIFAPMLGYIGCPDVRVRHWLP